MKRIYGSYHTFADVDFNWKDLQITFLKEHGMKPHHYLLDAGCGIIREGVYLIQYLDKEHYYGIDADTNSLKMVKTRLKEFKLEHKQPTFKQMARFEFEQLNMKFDYACAFSLFTHLDDNDIKLCLSNIQNVLKPNTKFYSTFFRSEGDETSINRTKGFPGSMTTHRKQNPFHQPLSFYESICPSNLKLNYIGEWDHPREQQMLEFIKTKE